MGCVTRGKPCPPLILTLPPNADEGVGQGQCSSDPRDLIYLFYFKIYFH